MEVYILDDLLRRDTVIDVWVSFIWTERFYSIGDFQLVVAASLQAKNAFTKGTQLAMSESDYIMVVETVEDDTSADGVATIKITGPAFENILDNRVARDALSDLTTDPKWILTDTPINIATQIFHDICVTGVLDAADVIPYINEGTIYPPDTIPPSADTITYEMDLQSVYTAIATLCVQYNMGFRIVRDGDTSALYFNIYTGSDRTTAQHDLPAVVFSPDMDNLQNTSALTSIALYKNVVYVISPVGSEVVYALDVDSSTVGYDRRVLFIKADDITDPDPPTASALMIQRGTDELAKARQVTAFDGEIPQSSQYVYGRDYHLGDLLERRDEYDETTIVQVTEQIFTSDSTGDHSYPTLTAYEFVTSGSWNDTAYNIDWDTVDTALDWDDA